MDYGKTLNLPQTDFPMRANLPEREPEILDQWAKEDIYGQKMKTCKGAPKFILHDGPPYANGNIHTGTALNKVLKDIVLKYKFLQGFDAPYVPGWDTHGLPIEHGAIKILGLNRHELDPLELRKECKKYALKYLDIQRDEFKRLGVTGDWDNPYITLVPSYEAKQIEIFGKMANKGYIYKGLKSVYWCTSCETALAEAEIEYHEKKSHSIYVKFPLVDDKGILPQEIDKDKVFAVIWTTTPWTLPANVAISIHPELEYVFTELNGEIYLFAKDLIDEVIKNTIGKDGSIHEYKALYTVKGAELEGVVFKHPFMDRESPILLGTHVTLEQGTGAVHTAPGHGQEDFEIGAKYKLPVINPVDGSGKFTNLAGKFEGLFIEDANVPIIKELAHNGKLFGKGTVKHQYAHCWRCKEPVIYRATEQWFASVDDFREATLNAIDEQVQWIPSWGRDRIYNMVADRHDWCISRQRVWGLPIPAFYCGSCHQHIINEDTIKNIVEIFGQEGSNAWWGKSAQELLPDGFKCPHCGNGDMSKFNKETDTMDVWFDSGCSHASVLEQNPVLRFPADLYLEGSDQHRGWFQSSLLTSIATRGVAPYKAVLTHGFVVDGEGKKMSKSVGNVIYPQEIIDKYGADILRLWVSSSDYKNDIRISNDILKQMSEVYRKIRNTFRYILGNLADFDPNKDKVPYDDLLEIDRWILMRLEEVRTKVTEAYEAYEYHMLYHTIHNFCTIDLSSIYLDILKDRLYTAIADSPERRAAQTTIYEILIDLVTMISPVLTFTSEEVWKYTPKEKGMLESAQLLKWVKSHPEYLDKELGDKWSKILGMRSEITKVLEEARRKKTIGHSLDASVSLYAEGAEFEVLSSVEKDLANILIVSDVKLYNGLDKADEVAFKAEDMALKVVVTTAPGGKCERCWTYSEYVGKDTEHLTLCQRCSEIIKNKNA